MLQSEKYNLVAVAVDFWESHSPLPAGQLYPAHTDQRECLEGCELTIVQPGDFKWS